MAVADGREPGVDAEQDEHRDDEQRHDRAAVLDDPADAGVAVADRDRANRDQAHDENGHDDAPRRREIAAERHDAAHGRDGHQDVERDAAARRPSTAVGHQAAAALAVATVVRRAHEPGPVAR